MSKPRLTEQQRREKALVVAIARAKAEQGIETDLAAAEAIGIPRQNYTYYKKHVFQNARFELFCTMARKFGLTGREVCAAVGIPYAETSQ